MPKIMRLEYFKKNFLAVYGCRPNSPILSEISILKFGHSSSKAETQAKFSA